VDVSGEPIAPGSLVRVKVLGALCLLDQGELDWKLFVVNSEVAQKKGIKSLSNLDTGLLNDIREWFRMIKTYDGKPKNEFGYGEKVMDGEFALNIVEKHKQEYKELIEGKVENKDFWLR
jgi:inorganic pyrophosphatase